MNPVLDLLAALSASSPREISRTALAEKQLEQAGIKSFVQQVRELSQLASVLSNEAQRACLHPNLTLTWSGSRHVVQHVECEDCGLQEQLQGSSQTNWIPTANPPWLRA